MKRWDYGMGGYPTWKKLLVWAFVLALPFIGSVSSINF